MPMLSTTMFIAGSAVFMLGFLAWCGFYVILMGCMASEPARGLCSASGFPPSRE